jgi:hypothetical protein
MIEGMIAAIVSSSQSGIYVELVQISLELEGVQQHSCLRLDISGEPTALLNFEIKLVRLFLNKFRSASGGQSNDLSFALINYLHIGS